MRTRTKQAAALAATASIFALLMLTAPIAALTLKPAADAYVKSDAPTTNYGTGTTIRVDGSPTVISYLRFTVSGVSSVTNATLRVWANSAQSIGYDVSKTSSTWGETTVTYDTAPAIGTKIGSSGPVTAGTWTSVNVTSAVPGNGTYSFALTTSSPTALSLASRESGANAPQLIVSAASSSSPPPTPTPAPTAGAISHTVVIWLENHEYTSVTSSSMPYLTSLAGQYGLSTQFYAIRHPSLPNYLAFWSGSTQGVADDGTYNFSRPSLSSQLTAAGRSWRTFAQDYPSTAGCHTGSSYSGGVDLVGVSGTYARKHNPAMSFTSVSGNATECAKIQPLASFDPNVNVAFVVPNLCNDAHDCSLTTADNFLKAFVPKVTSAPDWAHTLLVISWDEGTTSTNGGGRIYTVVMRPGMAHLVSSTTHNHYGLLRTIENLNGVGCLGSACTATQLTEFLP